MGWLQHLLQDTSNHFTLQLVLTACATLFVEDPVTITCGLLVADHQMQFLTAYFGVTLGIAVGDFTLYGIGRAVGPKTVQWRIVPSDRLERVRGWFNRNMIVTVLVARFVPGFRLPTYVGAGIFRASPFRFLGLALFASLIWTLVLLTLTVTLGQAIFPKLGPYRWAAGVLLISLFIIAQYFLARGQARRMGEGGTDTGEYQSPVSIFEFWPAWLFYMPLLPYYFYLSLRYMGPTLPSAVNPAIHAGGLLGDAKSDLLRLIPPAFTHYLAPWIRIELADPPLPPDQQLAEISQALARAELSFPLVAKPDIGHRGAGVQPVRNEEQLRRYVESFPSGKPLLLQQLVDLPGEAGIVYYRRPSEAAGHIFSLTLKRFPAVLGDGRRTLRELIMADERAAIIHDIYFRRHKRQLERVLAAGEVFQLVFTGNHRQGAILEDGNGRITPELTALVDTIARAIPDFHYGRFEVRFSDLDAFLRGEDFTIVELNGAGAEALHIWDAKMTLWKAYRTLFSQWRLLFQIGAENRRRGMKPARWRALWRDVRAHFRPPRHYPPTS